MNDPDKRGISRSVRCYEAGLAASLLCLSGCNGTQVFGQSVVPGGQGRVCDRLAARRVARSHPPGTIRSRM